MAVMNRQVILAARPEGVPKESDFKLVERPLPPLHDGTFLVRTEFFSVDPYMRMRISEQSYAEPTNIGDVMLGGAVGDGRRVEAPGVPPRRRRRGRMGLAGVRRLRRPGRAARGRLRSRRSPPRSACWACRA